MKPFLSNYFSVVTGRETKSPRCDQEGRHNTCLVGLPQAPVACWVFEAMGFREPVLTTLVSLSFLQYASFRCLLPNLYIFMYFNLVSRLHLVFALVSYYLSASF